MKNIVRSMLDTDLYKISMGQFVLFQHPDIEVRYRLFNRGRTPFPRGFAAEVQDQIWQMESLKASSEELEFLAQSCPWLKPAYLDWLSTYRFNPREVEVQQQGEILDVKIEGPWYRTIYWEVPSMAIISELFFELTGQRPSINWKEKAALKARVLKEANVRWADFGTRRRYSYEVQKGALEESRAFSQKESYGDLIGTSNVYLAMKFGLKPIGTMAHEIFEVLGAVFGYPIATRLALEGWTKEFDGRLGIALTDTFTTDVFLRDFNWQSAKQFDGVRQDSGDPKLFVDKIVAHYQKLGIDPLEKTIVFSDGLTVALAIELAKYCQGKIKSSFGIGTSFTNDVGVKPLNIVIKVVAARKPNQPWLPAAKLSDDKGKWTGDNPEVFKTIVTTLGISE